MRNTKLVLALALCLGAWLGGGPLGCGGEEHEPDGDADADSDVDVDGDGDSDTDSDVDSDVDVDGDADSDTDVDGDGDTDGDADSDSDADPDEPCDTPGTLETVPCGACGTVERFCTAERVWAYGVCEEHGECLPGDTDSEPCGNCGTRVIRCNDECEWTPDEECTDEGECAPGTRTRTEDGCPEGQTRELECDDACEFVEVEACTLDSCERPGASETVPCGNCGLIERFCTVERVWVYGVCEGEGVCAPGSEELLDCGWCGVQAARCNDSCEWERTGECEDEGECEPGTMINTTEGCPEGERRGLECNDRCEYVEVEPCAEVTSADVLLLVDVTGSHFARITGIAETVMTELVRPLLDEGMFVGIAMYGDFPVGSYGGRDDRPFAGVIEPTDSGEELLASLTSLRGMSGADRPESGIEALHVLTGGELHPAIDTPMTCSAGRIEGGCWRPGVPRVIVVLTDAPNHNGPHPSGMGLYEPYAERFFETPPAEWPAVRDVLLDGGYGFFVRLTHSADESARRQHRVMLSELGQPESHMGEFGEAGAPGFAELAAMIVEFVFL